MQHARLADTRGSSPRRARDTTPDRRVPRVARRVQLRPRRRLHGRPSPRRQRPGPGVSPGSVEVTHLCAARGSTAAHPRTVPATVLPRPLLPLYSRRSVAEAWPPAVLRTRAVVSARNLSDDEWFAGLDRIAAANDAAIGNGLHVRRLSDVRDPDIQQLTSPKAVPVWTGLLAAVVGEGESCKSLL